MFHGTLNFSTVTEIITTVISQKSILVISDKTKSFSNICPYFSFNRSCSNTLQRKSRCTFVIITPIHLFTKLSYLWTQNLLIPLSLHLTHYISATVIVSQYFLSYSTLSIQVICFEQIIANLWILLCSNDDILVRH